MLTGLSISSFILICYIFNSLRSKTSLATRPKSFSLCPPATTHVHKSVLCFSAVDISQEMTANSFVTTCTSHSKHHSKTTRCDKNHTDKRPYLTVKRRVMLSWLGIDLSVKITNIVKHNHVTPCRPITFVHFRRSVQQLATVHC